MKLQSLFRKKSVHDILKQMKAGEASDAHGSLSKHLGVKDLTAFGIAAIVGAGIFSTIGKASADGGPAVVFLFIFTAIACSFAAFAYAEFASMVPVSGSAYTYSYVAFGELMAWIIGWALIMEYAIGNITVAISWSDYFTGLLGSMGLHLPDWMTMDYLTASRGFKQATALMAGGEARRIDATKLHGLSNSTHLSWTPSCCRSSSLVNHCLYHVVGVSWHPRIAQRQQPYGSGETMRSAACYSSWRVLCGY